MSNVSVYIHTLQIDYESSFLKIENRLAVITGGPLFDDLYEFERMYFYWGDEGNSGSENKINSEE